MKGQVIVLTLLAAFVASLTSSLTPATAAGCQFVLGFKAIHDMIPGTVGDCREDQHYAANGDAQQLTSGGLLAWRKADNWTAFTDGYHTWVNGPNGLQERLNTERFPFEHDTQPAPAGSNTQQGITFGSPVILGESGLSVVAVLTTNTTGNVKSFTAKATYLAGGNIVGVAVGAVDDLRPGQTRAAVLLPTGTLPTTYDSARVDVDTMIEDAPSTPGASVAAAISFGNPSVSTTPIPLVQVQVTNGDKASHSFTVQAAFVKGGNLIGVAAGAVNDLAAGQTKTATLLGSGNFSGYDQLLLNVDTVVQ